MAGVAQQVVKDARQLVRIALVGQLFGQIERILQFFFGKDRLKLAGHLLEHAGQIDRPGLERQVGQVEACDVEKFVDEVFEPLGLFKRNACVARAQPGRDVRFVA